MPKRSSIKRPIDLNQLAVALVSEATDESAPEPVDDGKDPNAVALGRKGGLKGGKARAAALTAEQRKEIARKAAAARWGEKPKG
jgi:hypothetical protein